MLFQVSNVSLICWQECMVVFCMPVILQVHLPLVPFRKTDNYESNLHLLQKRLLSGGSHGIRTFMNACIMLYTRFSCEMFGMEGISFACPGLLAWQCLTGQSVADGLHWRGAGSWARYSNPLFSTATFRVTYLPSLPGSLQQLCDLRYAATYRHNKIPWIKIALKLIFASACRWKWSKPLQQWQKHSGRHSRGINHLRPLPGMQRAQCSHNCCWWDFATAVEYLLHVGSRLSDSQCCWRGLLECFIIAVTCWFPSITCFTLSGCH